MAPLRVHATADVDGELHLTGLPIHKGQHAQVLVLPDDIENTDILAALQSDPSWAWLQDSIEDVYTEQDAR